MLQTTPSSGVPLARPRRQAQDDNWRMVLTPVREVGGLEIFERRPAIEMDEAPKAAGVAYTETNGRVLLLRRSDSGDRVGTWAFPGGGIESGETPETAAARECQEEIGRRPKRGTLTLLSEGDGRYWTYRTWVGEEFEPILNEEHDDWVWASPDDLPEPLHPGVKRLFAELGKDVGANDEAFVVTGTRRVHVGMAVDRESVRNYDKDGRLHVSTTPISKATVNPYWGHEIPGYQELGLDPQRQYNMLRHPEELAKAAGTFNNLPVLSKHVPVNITNHHPELVVGSTGTDARYAHPYLMNSLVFWAKPAIDDIQAADEDEESGKKELSCAYRYTPDMTPGTYEGQRYDGIMRNLVGNHVAHVEEGRAGPDVMVGDSKEIKLMAAVKPMSRVATLLMGATYAFLQPRLAKDEKVDLNPIFRRVTPKNYKDGLPKVVDAIGKAIDGKLAFDATPEGLHVLLEALSKVAPQEAEEIPAVKAEGDPTMPGVAKEANEPPGLDQPEDPTDPAAMADPTAAAGPADPSADPADPSADPADPSAEPAANPMDQVKAFIKANMQPEAFAQLEQMMNGLGGGLGGGGEVEDEELNNMPNKDLPKPGGQVGGKDTRVATKDTKLPAMDETQVRQLIDAAVAGERKSGKDLREAEQFVFPFVGRLAGAFDSADGILRTALRMKGVDAREIKEVAALRLLLSCQKKLVDEAKSPSIQPRVAQDAASSDNYHKMFGNDDVGFA